MATEVNINFLRSENLPSVPEIKKIIVSSDKIIDINFLQMDGQTVNKRYNFSSAFSMNESGQSPNGYTDLIYRYLVADNLLKIWLACVVPENTEMPNEIDQTFLVEAFPETLFLAEGISDGSSTITETIAWTTALATLSDEKKKEIAIREIETMLAKKESDIENASKFLDLNPQIPAHVGYWWRSAVAVIKRFYQDTTVDKLIVAEMAKQAAAGPTTRNDQLTLLRNLTGLITRFPNGPNFAAIWVETRNLNSPSDVQRKTVLEVLQTRGTGADETYPMPDNFDSTDESWLV